MMDAASNSSEASSPIPIASSTKVPSLEDIEADGEGCNTSTTTKGDSTWIGASWNYMNSICGAGIVGMPYAFKQTGMVTGAITLFAVAWLVLQSVDMLIALGLRHGTLDFEALSLRLAGRVGYIVTLVAMFVFAFGAMVAYIVVIGDTMPLVVAAAGGELSRTSAILIFSTFIVLPLSLLKDFSQLAWSSFVSITADVLLAVIVSIGAPASARAQNVPPVEVTFISESFFVGLGTFSFSFVCMHNSFIIFRSLETQTMQNWKRVSFTSIGFGLVMCNIFAFAGFLSFGLQCQGDVLNNFQATSDTVNVARGFFAVAIMLTYPQELMVSRHCVQQIIRHYQGCPTLPCLSSSSLAMSMFRSVPGLGSGFESLNDDSSSPAQRMTLGSSVLVSSETDERERESSSSSTSSTSSSTGGSSSAVVGDHKPGQKPWQETPPSPTAALAASSSSSSSSSTCFPPVTERDFYLVSLGLFVSTVGIAIVCDDLGVVLSLTGAVAASTLGYILPGCLYLISHQSEVRETADKDGIFYFVLALAKAFPLQVFLVIFGVVSLVLGVASVFVQHA